MKLIEIVFLVGSQCVSPLEYAPNETQAGKVPCAVVIQQDEEAGRLHVSPMSEANHPNVRAALITVIENAVTGKSMEDAPAVARHVPFDPATSGLPGAPGKQERLAGVPRPESLPGDGRMGPPSGSITRIAPASSTPHQRVSPVRPVAGPEATPAAAEEPAPPTTSAAAEDPPQPKASPRVASADGGERKPAAKRSDKCRGSARPQWYTNKDGRRRYRCAVGGKTSVY